MSEEDAGRPEPQCWCCSTGGDLTAATARLREIIRASGHAVVAVPRGERFAAYTVGLSETPGLRELYATGGNVRELQGHLNGMAEHQRATAPWRPGDQILSGRQWFAVRKLEDVHLFMGMRLYGRQPPALFMEHID